MTVQKLQRIDYNLSLSAYGSSVEYLFDELNLLDLKLKRELLKRKVAVGSDLIESQSIFISEEEILCMLSPPVKCKGNEATDSAINAIGILIENKENEIKIKCSNTEQGKEPLLLNQLSQIFCLTEFEKVVIVAALAPDIDVKYERVYAYFNDDLNKRTPSLDLIINLYSPDLVSKVSSRRFFSKESKLFRFQLLNFVNNSEEESFLNGRVKVDEGIRAFLLGDATIHPILSDLISINYAEDEHNVLQKELPSKEILKEAVSYWLNIENGGVVTWLYGEASTEKDSLFSFMAKEFNLPVMVSDLSEIMLLPDPVLAVKLLCREALLKSSVLHISSGDKLCNDDGSVILMRDALLKSVNEYSWFAFISAGNMWMPDKIDSELRWVFMEMNLPDFAERRSLWWDALKERSVAGSDLDIVASRFKFSENRIRMIASHASFIAGENEISLQTLLQACSYQSTQKITKYTKKIKPHFSWDDLVLNEDKLSHLKEISNTIKNKHTVFYKWGFDSKLALGRGVNMLFSGPSGTGKTMTAEIMASDLNLDLYKTDLSSLVSKYIGETEKNLSKIFNETSSGSSILFFDEADALFGKRSEVKDAHDRYANIEINYLLQKIEEHEGVVILSTNFSNNIDEAFLRRMNALVEFPFPDEMHRELIWKKIFPDKTPLSEDIDYKFLATKINTTGGNIKNIALAGAFLAAHEDSTIEMHHIINAVKREYQKMGKPFVKDDFKEYLEGEK